MDIHKLSNNNKQNGDKLPADLVAFV